MAHPAYYGIWHKLGSLLLKSSSYLVLLFLILPILVIVPLSFNAEPFFTFTEGMLRLDPAAYSLRWYEQIFTDPKWLLSIKNSFIIGIFSTILATVLGTCAAIGLARDEMPGRRFARLRGDTTCCTAAGSRLYVSGSMSANTTEAPVWMIASAVAKKVNGVVITSSPGPISSARSVNSMAAVPDATPTA